MRTKKAGRNAREDDSPGEDSDGAGSDLDQLPHGSSSDDDVGGPTIAIGMQPGGAALMGRATAPLPANHYMPMADPRMMANQHVSVSAGGAMNAVLSQAHGGGYVGMGLAGLGHLSQAQPAAHAMPSHANGGMAAAHATVNPSSALGARRATAMTTQRPASALEDPTLRRIKAQMRAVWLLERDLPVPPMLLAETKGRVSTHPTASSSSMTATPIRPWSAYEHLVARLSKGEGMARGGERDDEMWNGMIEQIGEGDVMHMKQQMERRHAFVQSIASSNMAALVADRLDLERRELELHDVQHEVRCGLLASHVDMGIPRPHLMTLFKTNQTRLDSAVVQEENKEEWEARMREAEQQRKISKHRAFLMDMQKTHRNFNREHDTLKRWRQQICKAVRMWHTQQEKSKEKERAERLLALKSNDFDKYREFVKEAKNERLLELIDKTDRYLSSLAAKMSKTAKMLSGAGDAAKTESLLELDHEILPLDADSKTNSKEGKTDADRRRQKQSRGKSGLEDERGMQDSDAAESEEEDGSGGGGEEEEEEEAPPSSADVDKIFAHVKGAQVVIKQARMMGDGDDGKSKEEGKPPLLLKPYQLQGVQWMVTLYNNNLSGILADEMGLGKTIQVIGLLTYLVETKGEQGPFMIIAPLSTLTNWALEFRRWAPTLDVVVYKGTKEVRKELLRTRIKTSQLHVLIIQYEMVMSPFDLRTLKQVKWAYMVVDEGHRLKNKDSKLFTVLTKEYDSRRKLILTGTPLQNNIGELWNLLNFLLPTVFDTDADFKSWFSKPFALCDDDDDKEESIIGQEEQMVLINRLHQVLRPFMLRRVKTDKDLELSMPENREVVIKCTLSALQKIQYRQLSYATLRTRDDKGNLKTTSYNNTIMRLRQVCNHPYLMEPASSWDLGAAMRVRVCGKLDVLDRILPKLKAAGHRVLIYSQMVQLLEILAEYIEGEGYIYRQLIGSTASEVRAEMIADFNKPDSDIFLFILSTRAGGQGVNLQTADTVVIFDSDWNPMMDEQAKARINRIGQTKQTLVIRLMTPGTVEEKMLSRANARLRMGDLVIEAGEFKVGASSKDAQAKLREKLSDTGILADIAQIDQEMATDDEINELIMRTESELELWQAMDQERLAKEQREFANSTSTPSSSSKGAQRPRLMQEEEVPEHLLGERIAAGDRVVLLDERLATVILNTKGHEWEVELDEDASHLVVHRTELQHAPTEETEESHEAARLARRRQTNRSHSVSHHGLTEAEFTRCIESGKDIDDYIREKKTRADRGQGKALSGGASEAEGRPSRSRKSGGDTSSRKRQRSKRYNDDESDGEGVEEEEEEEEEEEGQGGGRALRRARGVRVRRERGQRGGREGGVLLVHGVLSYQCMGPYASSVWGLELLVYGA